MQGLQSVGLSAVQTGMDNVRNMTGSPIAGIDPHELIDVRQLNYGAHPILLCAALKNSSVICVHIEFLHPGTAIRTPHYSKYGCIEHGSGHP